MFPLRDLNPSRTRPLVMLLLVLVNIGVFFLWQPIADVEGGHLQFLYRHAVVPCELATGEPLTLQQLNTGTCVDDPAGSALFPEKDVPLSAVVSLFLHGGLLHLLGNMWFLWLFGDNIEEAWGHIGFAIVYVLSGIVATAAFVGLHVESTTPLVGASGAIAGVLGSYFILYPGRWVISLVFVAVIPVPALIFLGLWFVLQFFVDDPGVAWEAHAAGFIFGMAVTLPLRGFLLGRVRRKHRAYARV
jgi:membrane associated rhomboid family serine protease